MTLGPAARVILGALRRGCTLHWTSGASADLRDEEGRWQRRVQGRTVDALRTAGYLGIVLPGGQYEFRDVPPTDVLHKIEISDDRGHEFLIHYASVPGQHDVYTLCGWDGGRLVPGEPRGPVACQSCLAIVKFFRKA